MSNILKAFVASGVEFKRALHDLGLLLINDDNLNAGIVQIAQRRGTRIVAAFGFGVKAAFGVRFEVKDKLIGHAELHARHQGVVCGIEAPVVRLDVPDNALL
ncbi:MAG: hypothetical protein WC621_02470 [Patescibacteria group bacterium]